MLTYHMIAGCEGVWPTLSSLPELQGGANLRFECGLVMRSIETFEGNTVVIFPGEGNLTPDVIRDRIMQIALERPVGVREMIAYMRRYGSEYYQLLDCPSLVPPEILLAWDEEMQRLDWADDAIHPAEVFEPTGLMQELESENRKLRLSAEQYKRRYEELRAATEAAKDARVPNAFETVRLSLALAHNTGHKVPVTREQFDLLRMAETLIEVDGLCSDDGRRN